MLMGSSFNLLLVYQTHSGMKTLEHPYCIRSDGADSGPPPHQHNFFQVYQLMTGKSGSDISIYVSHDIPTVLSEDLKPLKG